MESKSLPQGIVNPFSEKFVEYWDRWKDFRWQEHKFKYKGCISEQTRLMQLCELAGGQEDVAIAIILQSIGHGWSGFYELKNKINGQPGKSGQKYDTNSLKEKLVGRFGHRK